MKQITDHDFNPLNRDTVTFSNLSSADLSSVRRNGQHLEMNFVTRDQLMVSNYFLSSDFKVEAFRFSNGVTFGETQLMALLHPF